MAELKVTKLAENIWDFNEPNGEGPYVDAYLVVGEKRAALIDALQDGGGLVGLIREITGLPVDVLITHGHGDHAGKEVKNLIGAGCDIYMNHLDIPVLNGMFSGGFSASDFKPLENGQKFDIGGTVLEAFALPGHTPGSMLFIDRAHGRIFSGDTVGSGPIWLQLPHSAPLGVYLEGVKALEKELGGLEVTLFPGHRYQSPVELGNGYLADMRVITEKILSGEIVGEPYVVPGRESVCGFSADYRLVHGYVYRKAE